MDSHKQRYSPQFLRSFKFAWGERISVFTPGSMEKLGVEQAIQTRGPRVL